METIISFVWVGDCIHKECYFCHSKISVQCWATIGPKERVPACSNCIVSAIKAENAAKS